MSRLHGKAFDVRVGADARIEIESGGRRYAIESSFSYPGRRLGWNHLSGRAAASGDNWIPVAGRRGADVIKVQAVGRHYSLNRTIRLDKHRVKIEDKLTSRRRAPVGIIMRHHLIAPPSDVSLLGGLPRSSVAGNAQNPTVFISHATGGLGVVAEDSIFRLQFNARSYKKRVTFGVGHFALAPDKCHTFEWAIYPIPGPNDYFDFINQIRNDWNTNFPIIGPFCFFNVTYPKFRKLLEEPAALKAYFQRNRAEVLCLVPWLDYDNLNQQTGEPYDRAEYKRFMQAAMTAIRQAAPDMLFVGAMEGDLVDLPQQCIQELYKLQPRNRRTAGCHSFSRAQMATLRRYDIPWKDCLVRGRDGRCAFELFYRGGRPLIAAAVYAARGNAQHKHWLEQARFMIEEVGMDGVYTDQFSLVLAERFTKKEVFSHALRYSYDRWDGVTVGIDPETGRILRKYTDGALAGIGARADLIGYVLSRGKVMVANTHAAATEIQSRPIFRFVEAQLRLDPLAVRRGHEPPLRPLACTGQLGSPIGLGWGSGALGPSRRSNYAKAIIKTAIAYLRHGLLYYHYNIDIPESGSGSHALEPINHMFPLTPVGLHKGWIEGKERIVTCVAGPYRWPHRAPPRTYLFDVLGRALPHRFAMKRSGQGWDVQVRLENWQQIAILEAEARRNGQANHRC